MLRIIIIFKIEIIGWGVFLLEYSDTELVQRCLDGENEAFEQMVDRYKRLVYSVAMNMFKDKEEVYDVSQEVFLKIYKSLDKYNSEYKLSTWIVRITTNHCLDILRKKRPQTISLDKVAELSRKKDTPEERYINKEGKKELRDAVDSLPEKYKLLIVLYHRQGLSYDEIVKVTGEPMSIVKNRLYRARQMLKDMLSEKKEEM